MIKYLDKFIMTYWDRLFMTFTGAWRTANTETSCSRTIFTAAFMTRVITVWNKSLAIFNQSMIPITTSRKYFRWCQTG